MITESFIYKIQNPLHMGILEFEQSLGKKESKEYTRQVGRFGDSFRFFLATAYHANNTGFAGGSEQNGGRRGTIPPAYAFVDEWAVLAHGAIPDIDFQGSDLDLIVCGDEFINMIVNSFEEIEPTSSRLRRRLAKDKSGAIVTECGNSRVLECAYDFWMPRTSNQITYGDCSVHSNFFNDLQIRRMFGIPIPVPNPNELIRMTATYAGASRHSVEIIRTLTDLLESNLPGKPNAAAESLAKKMGKPEISTLQQIYSTASRKLVGKGGHPIKETNDVARVFCEKF